MPNTQNPLIGQIQDRAHGLGALTVGLVPPTSFPRADPYLLASAVQKAIRRGDLVVARSAGHQLCSLDRQRLWRRLAVIALEDVGIADVEVVADLVAISSLPAARQVLGGDIPALDVAIVRACATVKDRTGDHFASVITREPASDNDRAALRTASPNGLLAMLASSDLPWTRRLRAALLVSGRTDDSSQSVAANLAVFGAMRELGVPRLLLAACETYASRQRDALPVFVPFAWVLDSPGCSRSIIIHELPAAEMIGEWPSYVFDPLWTRIGKRAVRLWLQSYDGTRPFTERQVAAALWNAESALCDRTLSWSMSNVLRVRAYAADLSYRGLPVERHAELMAWVTDNRPSLIAARTEVWNDVIRAFGKPAERLEQANLPLPVPLNRKSRDQR